jgi:hypothetical protein
MGVTFADLPAAGGGLEEAEVGRKRSAAINLGMLRQGRRKSDRTSQNGASETGEAGRSGSASSSRSQLRMSGALESEDGSKVSPPLLLNFLEQ